MGINPSDGSASGRPSAFAGVPPEDDPAATTGRSFRPSGLSPTLLSYLVGPIALAILLAFRHFGLVARLPIWAYVAALLGAGLVSVVVEPWHRAPAGSFRWYVPVGVHLGAVSVVIYMTGWGPALVMAYAFVALEEVESAGAALWRPVMILSLANIAVAQFLIWEGLAPSFLSRSQAETVGVLGMLVLAMVIRMAGATAAQKERAEKLLAHQALHDMLTGLPNRAFFYERTDRALEVAASDGSLCAVMLFDLDRFKEINDTLGHKFGDQVLTEVGPRVETVLRSRDVLARLGGDEFCVLLPEVSGVEDALAVAERIIGVLEEPFDVDGTILGIEASCGISLAPSDGDSADLLLQRADVAMYVAKESSSSVIVYTDDLGVNTPDRLALLGDLRTAVAEGQFVLHFQPKAAMATGAIEGAEALIRWQHPTLGLLFPDSFIPEAERSGLIEPMTHWVLDAALAECRRWMDLAGPGEPTGLSIAVNLSARSLLDVSLPHAVQQALARWRVPPHQLDLEITETIIMTDPARARRVLHELADIGVTLSIDDFGTGYSSLAYLRDLPVHQLKIDRSFVQELGRRSGDVVIVRAVIDLARNLGLRTVAEGVEDVATWDQLTRLGCNSAQGYLMARPLAAAAFWEWIGEQALVTSGPTDVAIRWGDRSGVPL